MLEGAQYSVILEEYRRSQYSPNKIYLQRMEASVTELNIRRNDTTKRVGYTQSGFVYTTGSKSTEWTQWIRFWTHSSTQRTDSIRIDQTKSTAVASTTSDACHSPARTGYTVSENVAASTRSKHADWTTWKQTSRTLSTPSTRISGMVWQTSSVWTRIDRHRTTVTRKSTRLPQRVRGMSRLRLQLCLDSSDHSARILQHGRNTRRKQLPSGHGRRTAEVQCIPRSTSLGYDSLRSRHVADETRSTVQLLEQRRLVRQPTWWNITLGRRTRLCKPLRVCSGAGCCEDDAYILPQPRSSHGSATSGYIDLSPGPLPNSPGDSDDYMVAHHPHRFGRWNRIRLPAHLDSAFDSLGDHFP